MADNINYSKIVKNIKKEVVKHLDKVVKNQNCMLCAWCTELQARGKDTLPRPVHSPRDVIFSLGKNNTIVLDPKIEKFKDKKDLENKIKEIPNSRFYVHVDWKNGGGHEFIAINKNGNVYAVDSQDGIIKKLNLFLNDKYIDFKKSYTFRTDDKKINNNILKYNNMKYYIPWNDNDKKILKQDSKRRITMSNLIKENRRKIVKDDHVNEGEKFVGKDLRLSELKEEKNLMGVVLSLADDSELYVAVSPYQDLDTTFYTTSSIDISNKYVLIGEADELTVRDCQLNNIEMFDTQEKAIEKTKTYYKKMSVGDEEPLKRAYKLFASDGSEESRRFESIEEAENALRNEGTKFKNSKDGEYKYELICYSYDNNTGKVYQDKLNEYIITVSNGTVKAKKRKIAEMKDGCTKDGDVNDTYLEDDIDCGGDISVQPNGDVIVTIEYEGDGGDNSTSKVKLDKATFFEMVNEMYDYKYEDIDDTNELLKALDNEPDFNDMENEFWKKVYEIDLDNAEKDLEEAE